MRVMRPKYIESAESIATAPWNRVVASTVVAVVLLASSRYVAASSRVASPGVSSGARVFITKVYDTPDFRQLADAGFTHVVRDTDIMDPTNNAQSVQFRKVTAESSKL